MKEKKSSFPVIQPDAAGIDISSKEHFVAVHPDRDVQPIRSFGAFTEDLLAMAAWLRQCGVTTVAMEATCIYWVSLYLVSEEAGFEVLLVNARHVKNVRGKKGKKLRDNTMFGNLQFPLDPEFSVPNFFA